MNKNNTKILALKYRPRIFKELIGQEVIAETISNAIKLKKTPNAYLLTGIRGVGKTTTARLIAKSEAKVIPIYFKGSNSRIFQIASHLHYNLRMALLINEFGKRTNDKVSVVIGKAFDTKDINKFKDNADDLMQFLRTETYKLSPDQSKNYDEGFDFDA